MKILITGSNGFIARNLIARLESQNDINHIIYKYDIETPYEQLTEYTKDCDFVYNLAAVHRPEDKEDFNKVNFLLFDEILGLLEKNNNSCPVLYTSSIQVKQDTDYAKSKLRAEESLILHGKKVEGKAIIYRLTNTFGKWARPNSHSVIATFCYNIARGLDINISDLGYLMDFYYIDDVIDSFVAQLNGKVSPGLDDIYRLDNNLIYSITLGKLAELIDSFRLSRLNHSIPDMSDDFTKKLYSTYMSYLPCDCFNYPLNMNKDERGSFTEIFKTIDRGQFSVNITKPGISKGDHWHNTKCEKFLVVSGKALIQFRKIDAEEIIKYPVSSEHMEILDIPVGYTHNIINIGDDDLVTLMWANEIFNLDKMDTYHLMVDK